MINKFSSFIPAALLATGVAFSANVMPADAFGIDFYNVTKNEADVAPNFTVSVDDIGNNQVQFRFNNSGIAGPAAITDIYFGKNNDKNPLLDFASYLSYSSIINNPVNSDNTQVAYSPVDDSKVGGGIKWGAVFTAEPDSPGGFIKNGVGVGESLAIVFNLVGNTQYSQLENLFNNGTMAIAFHAQGLGDRAKGSDWYASHESVTSNDVPEPFTILGTGAAIGFASLFRREQSKRQNKSKVKA